jgi:signal transduction histidine kinase/BarA-like signal transduction histidine kinase
MKQVKHQRYIWVVVLLIAAIVAGFTVRFYHSVKVQLFTERQSHLTELTVKISEVIDVTIETMQEKTDSAAAFIEQNDIKEEDMTATLEGLSQMLFIDDGVLLTFDDQGRYYSSEGKRGRWSEGEDLVATDNKPVIRDIVVFGEKKSCMVLFNKLQQEKSFGTDGTVLTHVATALPIDTVKEYLTISMFEKEGYTYLINQEGRRLYKQTFSNPFIEDFNVISALEEDEFVMGGTVEDLINSINNRENLCVEFKEETSGKNYFVSTVPVQGSDWTVLLFVPTDVLGVKSANFMSSMIRYFMVLCVAGIAVLCYLVFAVTTSKNDKKMIEQQEKNNALLALTAQEAREANAAKSEFLANMSHDIRTPINGILGMTHIAISNKDNPDRVEDCIHKIDSAADHLLTLVNDVLDMSAIESGKVVIAHESLDIRTLIDNCVSIIEGQLASRKLTFNLQMGGLAHPYVYGDQLHLRQVLINIMGNAVKFTEDGGNIELRVQEISFEDNKVTYCFEVEDNGIGMSEDFQKRIFDEFSQEAKSGRTTYQGTGLGMAITKNFVNLMGGRITVRSRQGEGSCFTVTITFDVDETHQEKEIPNDKAELNGMKVLVVEDNELNMEIALEILKEQGIITKEAENGQVAYDKFMASKPGDFDAILMDIMMPVMNGYDATKAIRASEHPRAKTIPIIAMTANAYQEDVEQSKAAGMNAHVPKPINIKLLLSVLEQYKNGSCV